MSDPRKFDGPFDKWAGRDVIHRLAAFLDSALAVPLPGGEGGKTYGPVERVEAKPGDHGYRFAHRSNYAPDANPVSWDAGMCRCWTTPLGWRCIYCYQHDDPTHGLNIAIFEPDGNLYRSVVGLDPMYATSFLREMPI